MRDLVVLPSMAVQRRPVRHPAVRPCLVLRLRGLLPRRRELAPKVLRRAVVLRAVRLR